MAWASPPPGVALDALVEYRELRQLRKKPDQVPPTLIVPLANRWLREVVPARRDSRPDPTDLQVRSFQPHVPDPRGESDALLERIQSPEVLSVERYEELTREATALGASRRVMKHGTLSGHSIEQVTEFVLRFR